MMKKGLLLLLTMILLLTAFSFCGKEAPKVEFTFISYETDISGLSVEDTSGANKQILEIRIIQYPFTEYWLGRDYTVFSADTGEEVPKFDKYKFTDDQIWMEPDEDGSKGSAAKQFQPEWFDFKKSGEYIFHSKVYKEPADHYGTLDIHVNIQVSGK